MHAPKGSDLPHRPSSGPCEAFHGALHLHHAGQRALHAVGRAARLNGFKKMPGFVLRCVWRLLACWGEI